MLVALEADESVPVVVVVLSSSGGVDFASSLSVLGERCFPPILALDAPA